MICRPERFLGLIGLPLFFTDILPLWAFIADVVGLTGVGLAVFAARQRIEADHGFLAPMIEAIRDWSSGHAAKVAAKAPADAHEIRRSRFFAGVAERHGDEVADGPAAVLRIVSVFFLVSVFWALFDQHSSSWIRQAQRMDLHVLAFGTSFDLLPSQIPSLNPLMVMALIPLNNFLIYPIFARMGLNPTPLRRMTVGMLMAAAAFAIVALLQERIDTAAAVGEKIAITWQVLTYLIMTQAEVMVSVTGLEFAYSQAPRRMKSTIMGFWLLTVAFGSKLVIVITKLPDMELSTFFWVFAALMAGASVLFGMRAAFYTYRDYAQEG